MKKALLLALVLLLAFASLASATPSESEVIVSFKKLCGQGSQKGIG